MRCGIERTKPAPKGTGTSAAMGAAIDSKGQHLRRRSQPEIALTLTSTDCVEIRDDFGRNFKRGSLKILAEMYD